MSIASVTTKVTTPALWENDNFRKLLPASWKDMQKRIEDSFPKPYYFDIPPITVRDALISTCDRQTLLEEVMYKSFLDHPETFGDVPCSMCADSPNAIFIHTTGRYNESMGMAISLLIPDHTVEFAWSSESGEGGCGVWKDGDMLRYSEGTSYE